MQHPDPKLSCVLTYIFNVTPVSVCHICTSSMLIINDYTAAPETTSKIFGALLVLKVRDSTATVKGIAVGREGENCGNHCSQSHSIRCYHGDVFLMRDRSTARDTAAADMQTDSLHVCRQRRNTYHYHTGFLI